MVRRQRAPSVMISTTLNGGVTDTATSWTVNSASNMPSEGDFYLASGQEIVLVTARSGTTLTVVRGQCGTTGEAHNNGDPVKSIIVAEEFTNRLKDYGKIKTAAHGRVLDVNGTALTAASFTVINSGTGAGVNDGPDGTIQLTLRTHTGDDLTGATVSYSSAQGNKRYTAHLSGPTCKQSAGDHFGLYTRQNSGGQCYGIEFYPGSKIQTESRTTYLTDAVAGTTHGAPWRRDVWMRLEQYWDNPVSDQLYFSYSWDGVHWWQLGSYTGLSLATTEIGIWASNRTGVTFHAYYIETWIEEAL